MFGEGSSGRRTGASDSARRMNIVAILAFSPMPELGLESRGLKWPRCRCASLQWRVSVETDSLAQRRALPRSSSRMVEGTSRSEVIAELFDLFPSSGTEPVAARLSFCNNKGYHGLSLDPVWHATCLCLRHA